MYSIVVFYLVTTTTVPISSSQCYNYTTIDEPLRSVNNTSSESRCDQTTFSSGATWVRFVGEGGVQMPTSALAPNRCGTQAPGWYNGVMPSMADSTTNGVACFSWQSNTCNWSRDIQVTNCGSYYVYLLSAPPLCNLRYCTDSISTVS